MREHFQKADGRRGTFTAQFKRFGIKRGWQGKPETTILLLNVRDGSGQVTADHVWMTCGEQFKHLQLAPGDLLKFDARVRQYWKGYAGRKWSEYHGEQTRDYRLSFPTNVRKVVENAVEELPLFSK